MLKLTDYIFCLDIGSSKISAVLAEIKKKNITNVFFESIASQGVKDGASMIQWSLFHP